MSKPSKHVPASILAAKAKKGIRATLAASRPEIVSPAPREVEKVDIDSLARDLSETQSQVDAMLDARQSLKDRLSASEGAVTAALRAYSASPTDEALEVVDAAKQDEKDARKRKLTNADSLTLVQKDLAALKVRYDAALVGVISKRKVKLIKQRQKKTESHIQKIQTSLTELLITEHLAGTPTGIIDIKRFILKRMPDIKTDASTQAEALVRELK